MLLRDATPADAPALLALNEASVAVLSPMDAPRLAALQRNAALCRVVEDAGRVRAFVLAFREHADYDSPNYRWFDQRYPRFIYVDRVVVEAAYRGRGLGRRLYANVFALARREQVPLVACEFDVEPPNAASERFHARMGFREAGVQRLGESGKRVSLQVARVDEA
ncbi:GNAT family N-acetyltransferase [Cognatilysobacter segetis]|uniref:GNAT family N-acetyltransferase n=1 Tax=Cognatilysobacter segetis TaxID=2492394 RepID=UPI001EE4DE62|nr:GNAT family N-acetyltransferase [Lysobacter segetis]